MNARTWFYSQPGFALVLAVVGSLLFWAFVLPPSLWAAVLASLALGIMLTYAIVAALAERVAEVPIVRDRRVIEAEAHASLMAAAGVCMHLPGLAAKGCACGLAGGAR
jgi:hypothetical protein